MQGGDSKEPSCCATFSSKKLRLLTRWGADGRVRRMEGKEEERAAGCVV